MKGAQRAVSVVMYNETPFGFGGPSETSPSHHSDDACDRSHFYRTEEMVTSWGESATLLLGVSQLWCNKRGCESDTMLGLATEEKKSFPSCVPQCVLPESGKGMERKKEDEIESVCLVSSVLFLQSFL